MTPEDRKLLKDTVDSCVALLQEIDDVRSDIKGRIDTAVDELKKNNDIDAGKIKALMNVVRRQNLNEIKNRASDLEILYDEMLGLR